MKWPWSKKPEPAEEPRPEPVPLADDWTPAHSQWALIEVCHCGEVRDRGSVGLAGAYAVCPKCGHLDKWEKFVGCNEWEESWVRKIPFMGWPYYDVNVGLISWQRNLKTVRWTPEHCEVKDV